VIAELRTPAHFAVHGRGRALRVTTTCFCGIEAERRRRLPGAPAVYFAYPLMRRLGARVGVECHQIITTGAIT
jgi:hypothetical protein